MKLYHGSNVNFDTIDLSIGSIYKDFGQGFYLTPNIKTATRMAHKKTRLFGGIPLLFTFEFDESAMNNPHLKVKCFSEKATAEWFLFIDSNRNRANPHPVHDYDIVCGPIADDGVVLQLTDYHRGKSTPEQAAIDLQDKYLDQQYYFGSQAALQWIRKIKVDQL